MIKRKEGGGFTLVELLVVMAVLGVLMAGIVIAINPAQKMAQARDASRKNSVGQLGTALASYYTSQNATYPAAASWSTALTTTTGELKSFPPDPGGTIACATTNVVNKYCYKVSATPEAIVYSRLESQAEAGRCAAGNPYWMYSTTLGKACGFCGAGEPAVEAACSY